MWTLFVPPALSASPSALSHTPPNSAASTSTSDSPQFTSSDFSSWIDFQRAKGKAVSKDTWNLFVDFIRTIDSEFKEYDEEGEPVSVCPQLRGARRSDVEADQCGLCSGLAIDD